jgi:hypothetical protein
MPRVDPAGAYGPRAPGTLAVRRGLAYVEMRQDILDVEQRHSALQKIDNTPGLTDDAQGEILDPLNP